jgi:hypothetical protein
MLKRFLLEGQTISNWEEGELQTPKGRKFVNPSTGPKSEHFSLAETQTVKLNEQDLERLEKKHKGNML